METNVFDKNLIDRCRQISWDIEDKQGVDLALSLIDAQMLYCFYRCWADKLQPRTRPYFEVLWETCENAKLNADAADVLQDFVDTYQLSEDDILPVIAHPVTEAEYQLLHTIFDRKVQIPFYASHWQLDARGQTIIAQIRPQAPVGRTENLLFLCAAAADGKWSSSFLALIASNNNEVETPQGKILVSRMGMESQELMIRVEGTDGNLPIVSGVRLGSVVACRKEGKPNDWILPLDIFNFAEQKRLIGECPLVIHFPDYDVRILPPQDYQYDSNVVLDSRNQQVLHTKEGWLQTIGMVYRVPTLAAATEQERLPLKRIEFVAPDRSQTIIVDIKNKNDGIFTVTIPEGLQVKSIKLFGKEYSLSDRRKLEWSCQDILEQINDWTGGDALQVQSEGGAFETWEPLKSNEED